MKFDINGRDLSQCLSTLIKAIPSKTSLPLLECFHFVAEDGDMYVTASDAETQVTLPVSVHNCTCDCSFAVDAKMLVKPLNELKNELLTFDVNEQTFEVKVHYGNGEFSMFGLDAKLYPTIKIEDSKESFNVNFSVGLMKRVLSKSINQVSDDTLRPVMCGIYVNVDNNYAEFVSTNAMKLLVLKEEIDYNNAEPFSFILSKRTAILLQQLIQNSDDSLNIGFFIEGNYSMIRSKEFTVKCRLIEGKYPNYNSVIPTTFASELTVNKSLLANAVKRVSVFSNPASMLTVFDIHNNNIKVNSRDIDFATSAEEDVACQFNGSEMMIGFKSNYLLQLLSVIDDTDVVICLNDASRAALLKPKEKDNDKMKMILMPMML